MAFFSTRFTYIAPPGDLISTRVGPEGKIFKNNSWKEVTHKYFYALHLLKWGVGVPDATLKVDVVALLDQRAIQRRAEPKHRFRSVFAGE